MPTSPKRKVAICQPVVIFGGRLSVIVGMVRALNSLGIVPEVVTTQFRPDREDIERNYGKRVEFKVRKIGTNGYARGEWHILSFNRALREIASEYDLLVNTSNSLANLPESPRVLSYVFYPRNGRIFSEFRDIHYPEQRRKKWSLQWFSNLALRALYRRSSISSNHDIVTMTKFTANCLREFYPDVVAGAPNIYPSISISDHYSSNESREDWVVTAGRFVPGKRQLEQIMIAENLPDLVFHIFGFVGNGKYYNKCLDYIQQKKIENVHLHPSAPYQELIDHMQASKFFLHTLIAEPFGLTAVEAVCAGCIPMVHDSGGQRETVPNARLRYSSFGDVPRKIGALQSLEQAEIDFLRRTLQAHVSENYSDQVFHESMMEVFQAALEKELT